MDLGHATTAAAAGARLTQDGAPADTVAWVVADNADPATPALLMAAARDRFGRLDGGTDQRRRIAVGDRRDHDR